MKSVEKSVFTTLVIFRNVNVDSTLISKKKMKALKEDGFVLYNF